MRIIISIIFSIINVTGLIAAATPRINKILKMLEPITFPSAISTSFFLAATIEVEEGDAGNEYASGDKLGLMLPGLQEELLEAVTAIGKPVVLVLSAGSALDVSWADQHVASA